MSAWNIVFMTVPFFVVGHVFLRCDYCTWTERCFLVSKVSQYLVSACSNCILGKRQAAAFIGI